MPELIVDARRLLMESELLQIVPLTIIVTSPREHGGLDDVAFVVPPSCSRLLDIGHYLTSSAKAIPRPSRAQNSENAGWMDTKERSPTLNAGKVEKILRRVADVLGSLTTWCILVQFVSVPGSGTSNSLH